MHSKDFDEYVRRQVEAPPAGPPVDWNKQRDEWLGYLNRLYEQVESFLGKYVSARQIRFQYQTIELNEEQIGSYSARQMVLRIGKQEVRLVPIGTLLIGLKGRVDVVGSSGKAQIVLVDSDPRSLLPEPGFRYDKSPKPPVKVSMLPAPLKIQWEWKILTRPPERRFIDLTQESFFDLIMEVAHG